MSRSRYRRAARASGVNATLAGSRSRTAFAERAARAQELSGHDVIRSYQRAVDRGMLMSTEVPKEYRRFVT